MANSSKLINTPIADISSIVEEVDATFKSRKTQPIEWRKEQLRQLWRLLDEHNDELLEALHKDSSKLAMEGQLFDLAPVKADILHFLAKLDEWLAPEVVEVPSPYENWQPTIYKQPKGTVVIISPWNYPIVLTLLPLIGVIATGNTAIIKPSEVSTHSAEILTRLIPQYLDKAAYRFVNGGPEVVTALLKHPFGHIIYTGGANIGKIIMGAAAKTLTPVTLELGGKSPVIVTRNANLALAAKRLAWGKFWYSGQTCVAPDFLLVEDSVAEEFTGLLQAAIRKNYVADSKPHDNIARIINERHFSRVTGLLSATKGTVVSGGHSDKSSLFIEPTLITDLESSDAILQEEIFGPILPILKFTDIKEVPEMIAKIDATPLALYVFTEDVNEAAYVRENTSSGGMCINDAMGQMFVTSFAFGGFGTSGMGAYRGRASIDTFSHRKSVANVLTSDGFEGLLEWRYPDGGPSALKAKFEGFRANLEGKLES